MNVFFIQSLANHRFVLYIFFNSRVPITYTYVNICYVLMNKMYIHFLLVCKRTSGVVRVSLCNV